MSIIILPIRNALLLLLPPQLEHLLDESRGITSKISILMVFVSYASSCLMIFDAKFLMFGHLFGQNQTVNHQSSTVNQLNIIPPIPNCSVFQAFNLVLWCRIYLFSMKLEYLLICGFVNGMPLFGFVVQKFTLGKSQRTGLPAGVKHGKSRPSHAFFAPKIPTNSGDLPGHVGFSMEIIKSPGPADDTELVPQCVLKKGETSAASLEKRLFF